MEKSKETIINLFYIEHLKVKEIAEKINVSSAYITKIIKQDVRYAEEKLYRKDLSKEKRKIDKNKFIKNKRDLKRIEDNYSIVQTQHIQATRELSKSSHLSNESYRKWNISAYKYNPSKKRYEFDTKLGRSTDVPKYIKERWCYMEEKLLKLLKTVDNLNEKQNNYYAQIIYTADDFKDLRIEIISKKDHTYMENIEIRLSENSIITIDSIIELFESYVGGVCNE